MQLPQVTLPFFEKYILPFAIMLFTYFSPMFFWFGAIGFFITADLVVRCLILKRNKKPIESEKMWRTVYKFGIAATFISIAFFCEKYIVKGFPVMNILGSYLVLVELKSLDEKAKEVTGISVFGFLIEKLTPKK